MLTNRLELWGGVECTIARIGDRYRDQLAETGHHDRIEDLALIAGLGIRTLRYPVLWEALSADVVLGRGWAWHDERLAHLRELGIDPILGLMHHGSGPPDTDLLDPAFPRRFADHARAVAERYPWVTRYTPVNEPLTTARFSGLYGHWYPHGRSYPDFLRALVRQCQATVLAMEAIRSVNPGAKLVQTEDIGRVFSTPQLAYQARHENERRWLSLDLLFGRVRPGHEFWPILLENEIREDELLLFLTASPPDMIGLNHYLTSDRYLDGDLLRYPPSLHGSNGRDVYADAEAVRVAKLDGVTGPLPRMREVAERYEAPIAVTEVHHGCTREEQLRWFNDVWQAGIEARREGIDLRAVTLWSMFGTCDWNSLLTRTERIYEPGAFDARGPEPRPTALAHAARTLTTVGQFYHPVLAMPGWWRRPERTYTPSVACPSIHSGQGPAIALVAQPGPLVNEWLAIARQRGLKVHAIASGACTSVAGPPESRIWGVLDAGDCATSPSSCNEGMPFGLHLAARADLPYIFLSQSDVFDGRTGRSFVESDVPLPQSVSGRRRAAQEEVVLATHPGALVVRSGSLFGPGTEALGGRRPVTPVAQCQKPDPRVGELSYLPDLIHLMFDLLLDRESGIRHLVNGMSGSIDASPSARRAVRLATERGDLMPPLESALAREADRQKRSSEPGDWRVALVAAE